MSSPAISRKPVGPQFASKVTGFPPPLQQPLQQQFVFPGPPSPGMASPQAHAPRQMMPAPGQGVQMAPQGITMAPQRVAMPPQGTQYQTTTYFAPPPATTMARPPTMAQSQPMTAAAPQHVQTHWPAPATTTTMYQSFAPPPQQTPALTPGFAPAPTPGPGPGPYQSQAAYPPTTQPAQARPPMNGPPPQVGPRPAQMTSPTPSFHQHYPGASSIATTSPGLVAPAPVPGQIPGQIQRPPTSNSMHSLANDFDRRMSVSGTPSITTPMTSVSSPSPPQQLARAADGTIRTCVSCKQGIPQNLSIFTCLICSTAGISTDLCVWCYTTGSAGPSHAHDITYFVTDSDRRVQERVGYISPQVWTIRKNASGRMWYTYNETGFRTHIQPLTAVVYEHEVDRGLPPGWQETKTAEGKSFFRNQNTNASSWTKPKYIMPEGWKVFKTPDGVLFYVNETLKLSSWDRPGEQPQPKNIRQASSGPTTVAGTPQAGPVVKVNNVNKPSKTSRFVKAANGVALASNVANNVANLSAAADMSPSGILTAGIAATKLAGIGLKVAGKKMGRLGTSDNMIAAANLAVAASNLVGDGDDYSGGDFDFGGSVEEIQETQQTETTEVSEITMVDETSYTVAQTEPVFTVPDQSWPQQETFMVTQEQTFIEQQQPSYFTEQTTYTYDTNTVFSSDQFAQPEQFGQPDQFGQTGQFVQQDQFGQSGQFGQPQETVVVSNVDVTVQENLVNETVQNGQFTETNIVVQENVEVTVQETQYTETTTYTESTPTNVDVGQYVRQDAVITDFSDFSWADPPTFDNTAEEPTPPPEPQNVEPAPAPQYIEAQPEPPPEVVVQQPLQQTTDQPVQQTLQQPVEQPVPQGIQQPLEQPAQDPVQQPLQSQPQATQQPEMPQPAQSPAPTTAVGPSSGISGVVQPLLFEPILAAPTMVDPPAEQAAVNYNPQYLI